MQKIEKHGYFFRKNRLQTECKCGCVYLTPKKKVKIMEYHSMAHYYGGTSKHKNGDVYFETSCPECKHENTQWRDELMPPKEEER